jgi:DNA-binding FrmR family transcriptional regulator
MEKTCCKCHRRKKQRDESEIKLLKNRLSRIEGQIRGIKAMVDEGAYCPDIIVQVSAVSSALSSFSKALLTNHINTCVKEDILSGEEGAAEELATLIERLVR